MTVTHPSSSFATSSEGIGPIPIPNVRDPRAIPRSGPVPHFTILAVPSQLAVRQERHMGSLGLLVVVLVSLLHHRSLLLLGGQCVCRPESSRVTRRTVRGTACCLIAHGTVGGHGAEWFSHRREWFEICRRVGMVIRVDGECTEWHGWRRGFESLVGRGSWTVGPAAHHWGEGDGRMTQRRLVFEILPVLVVRAVQDMAIWDGHSSIRIVGLNNVRGRVRLSTRKRNAGITPLDAVVLQRYCSKSPCDVLGPVHCGWLWRAGHWTEGGVLAGVCERADERGDA